MVKFEHSPPLESQDQIECVDYTCKEAELGIVTQVQLVHLIASYSRCLPPNKSAWLHPLFEREPQERPDVSATAQKPTLSGTQNAFKGGAEGHTPRGQVP